MTITQKGFSVSISDFIDIALVIMAKTKDRDILDFYLDICPEKLGDSDFENYLLDKDFFVSGYESLANDMDELKDILKESGKWV